MTYPEIACLNLMWLGPSQNLAETETVRRHYSMVYEALVTDAQGHKVDTSLRHLGDVIVAAITAYRMRLSEKETPLLPSEITSNLIGFANAVDVLLPYFSVSGLTASADWSPHMWKDFHARQASLKLIQGAFPEAALQISEVYDLLTKLATEARWMASRMPVKEGRGHHGKEVQYARQLALASIFWVYQSYLGWKSKPGVASLPTQLWEKVCNFIQSDGGPCPAVCPSSSTIRRDISMVTFYSTSPNLLKDIERLVTYGVDRSSWISRLT